MKFLETHRKGILTLIKKAGFKENDFTFIKRRGRIYTVHSESQCKFGYLRVKETVINPSTKDWEHTSYYRIQQNDEKERTIGSWKEVSEMFNKWLVTLGP